MPDLAIRKQVSVERAYDEFCRRSESGETIDPDEFCKHHAEFRTSLYKRIELHKYFEDNPEALADLEPLEWPEVGEEFGECALVEELGFGGAARVFLAQEEELSRLVVLKVVAGDNGEAERLCRLKHPSIVPIYYVKQTEFLTALCMPFESRYTLNDFLDVLKRAPFPPRRFGEVIQQLFPVEQLATRDGVDVRGLSYIDGVLTLGRQLAEALDHSHRAGIYHLDLKPSNVLVKADGKPLLIDFNLSVMAGQAAEVFGGTKPYMSPEQIQRLIMPFSQEIPELDDKSDVFSLAVLITQILTGEHPFGSVSWRGTEQQLLLRQQEWRPSELKQFKNLDATIRRLLADCLVIDRNQRLDAGQLADRLDAILTRRRSLRTRRRILVAAAGVAAALTVGAGWGPGWAADWSRTMGIRKFEEGSYDEAISLLGRSIRIEPTAEALEYRALATLARGGEGNFREDALRDYEYAVDLSPDPALKAGVGYCQALTGGCRVARKKLNDAREGDYETAELLTVLAYCQLKSGLSSLAVENLDAALRQRPDLQSALYYRAVVEEKKNPPDLALALAYIEAALKIKTAHPLILYQAASILDRLPDEDNRIQRIAEYLEMAMQAGLARQALGNPQEFRELRGTEAFDGIMALERPYPNRNGPPLPHPNGMVSVSPGFER